MESGDEDEKTSEATTSNKQNEPIFDPKKEKWKVQRDAHTQFLNTLYLAQILIKGHIIQVRNKNIVII